LIINRKIIIHKKILILSKFLTMPCSICGSSDHNKRTCSSKSGATPSEIRVAKELSSLLPPVVTRAHPRGGKPLEGLQGCMNIFKEPNASPRRPHSRGRKPLEGLQGCMNIFKEPKASPPSPVRVHICSKCGASGHNSRTCEVVPLKETTKSSLNQRSCGLCGEKGHNSRTCLLTCKPCGDNSLAQISQKITSTDGPQQHTQIA